MAAPPPAFRSRQLLAPSISWSLPLLVLGSLFLIVAASGASGYFFSRARLLDVVGANLDNLAQIQAGQIDRDLSQHALLLEEMAARANVRTPLVRANSGYDAALSAAEVAALLDARNQSWLGAMSGDVPESTNPLVNDVRFNQATTQEFRRQRLGAGRLLLLDRHGAVVAATELPPSYSQRHRPWWTALQSGNRLYLGGPTVTEDSGGAPVMEFALPIFDDVTGEFSGVLYSAFDYAAIQEDVSQMRTGGASRTLLMARRPDDPQTASVLYAAGQLTPLAQHIFPVAAVTGQQLFPATTADGAVYLVTALPLLSDRPEIAALGWYVGAAQAESEALAPVTEAGFFALAIAGVIGLVIVAVLYVTYIRPLTGSLNRLRQGAARLQQGELNTQVTLKRRDELGLLADSFNEMARRLQTQIQGQEQVIEQRTAALQRQASQLEAAGHVARAASASLDLDALMADAVNLIRDRFGYYHASIFLLDEAGDYAVVRESTGEVGRLLKEQSHRLAVGPGSVVGWVTQQRTARVALNVGLDSVHFDNPLLPHTQSEVALPLIAQGELLGALDVQSTEVDAFGRDDLSVLQLMADQVASAIANARLFATVRLRSRQQERVIALAERLNSLRQTDEIIAAACQATQTDFGFDSVYVALADGTDWVIRGAAAASPALLPRLGLFRPLSFGIVGQAIQQGQPVLAADPVERYDPELPTGQSEAAVPIFTGDNRLGALHALAQRRRLDQNDVALLQLLAGAVGSAVANARFIATTQRNLAELDRLYRQASGSVVPLTAGEVTYLPVVEATDDLVQAHETALVARGQVIGRLLVEGAAAAWSEEDRLLAESVANQVSLALENSHLFAQTQVRLSETAALFTLTNLLTTTLDVDEIYRRAARAMSFQFNVARCAITSWDAAAASVVARVAFVQDQDSHLTDVFDPDEPVRNLDHYPATRQALEGHVPVVYHLDSPATTDAERALLLSLGYAAVLVVPLVTGNQAIGAAELYRPEGQPLFGEHDIHLAQAMASQTATALSNAMLASEAQNRVAQLSTLYHISQSLAIAPDLRSLFTSARQETMALIEATGMSILLLDDSRLMLNWAYGFEYGAEVEVSGLTVSIDRGYSGYVVRNGRPLLLNEKSDALRRELHAITVGAPAQAWLGVPLVVSNTLIGVLSVENAENSAAFTERDVQLLSTVAGSIAVAVANQSLLEQTQAALLVQSRQSLQLQAAAEVSSAASSIQDVIELMQTAVDLIQQRFALYYVGLFLVDDDNRYALLRAGTGEAARRQLERDHRLEVGGRSLVGGSTADGLPRIRQDVAEATDWQPNPDLPETRSEVALPLRVGGRVIGALTVQSTEVGEFAPEFVTILQTMSDQLGTAIDNAQLLAATRAHSTQLRVAADVSHAASTILDRDVLMTEVVELIRERFDLYYVGLFLREEDDTAVLRAGTGEAGRLLLDRGHRLPVGGHSMIGQAIAQQEARVAQDVAGAADWRPNPALPLTRSELALPLRTRGRTIGALTVQSQRLVAFSDDSITVLQTLADQLATAVENASLFRQLHQTLAETNRQYRAGRRLTEARDAGSVFLALVEFAADSGLLDLVHVIAPDPVSADHFYFPALWSRIGVAGDPARDRFRRDRFPFAALLARNELIVVPDGQSDPRFDVASQELCRRNGVRAVHLVPIHVEDKWLATLALDRVEASPLTEQALQPFMTLCDQAAVVLANQQLLGDTDALYRISRAFNQAMSQEDAIQIAVQELARSLGAAQARVVLYDREAGHGVVAGEYAPSGADSLRLPMVGDAVYDELDRERRPLFTIAGGATPNAGKTYLSPFGAASSLLIPAVSQQELVGFVSLDSFDSSQPFSPEQVNFAQAITDQFTTAIESIKLYEEALRRAQELIALNQIGTRISGTLDLNELARVVYEQVGLLLECDAFMLALYDAGSGDYRPLFFASGGRPHEVVPCALPTASRLHRLLHTGDMVVPDTDFARLLLSEDPAGALVEGEPNSSIWVPLQQEGLPTGLIYVLAYRSNAYHENQLQLLRSIATQAGLAITNAKLFLETQENIAELRLLFGITQAAAASIDAGERIESVIAALHNSLGGADVSLFASGESSATLERVVARGRDPLPQALNAHEGLVGKVMRLGQPLLVNDLSELPGYQPGERRILAQLVVPLILGRRTVGVINVESRQRDAFTERDLRLLQTLSVSLASTLESGRLFREIQAANDQLRELDRLKTQFLANMSHELRTPLNSIIGFSRVILKGIDGPITHEQEEDLTSIHNSGQHLLRLINDVLDLAKVEAGKIAMAFEMVDLRETAESVMASARGLIKDKPIRIRWEVEPELPPIEADPIRLRQILINFLSNAAKFTDEGEICLRITRRGPRSVHISVSDTGIGIHPTDYDRLFTAFEQVDSSATRSVGGTGLGLPITRRLVEMHGGAIWFESEVGRGSVFQVLLPIRQEEPAHGPPAAKGYFDAPDGQAARTPSVTAPANGHRPTILIVEDEPGVATLYQRYLRDRPLRLVHVHSGVEALAALAADPTIRLVLLDIFLPAEDGWALLRTIRQNEATASVPVVVCSIEPDEQKAYAMGAQLLLSKPIIEDDLLNALQQVGVLV